VTLALLGVAGLVGAFIGAVGVGGVLLGPALVLLGGASPNGAAATSSWAFLFTGLVGTVVYARSRTIAWSMLLRLAVGLIPAAFVGARTNALLSGDAVLLLLAVLTMGVGAQQLMARPGPPTGAQLSAARLVAIGVVVGFGSAVTGTGGPVLLVPLLLTLGVAPLTAVAVSQAAQLPVVSAASIGYLQAGLTDIRLGSLLGVAASAGVVAGALLARRLDPARLRQAVALACVVTGLLLVVRATINFG